MQNGKHQNQFFNDLVNTAFFLNNFYLFCYWIKFKNGQQALTKDRINLATVSQIFNYFMWNVWKSFNILKVLGRISQLCQANQLLTCIEFIGFFQTKTKHFKTMKKNDMQGHYFIIWLYASEQNYRGIIIITMDCAWSRGQNY